MFLPGYCGAMNLYCSKITNEIMLQLSFFTKWCRTHNIYTLYSLCPRAIKIGYNSLHNKSSNLWPIFRRTSWIDPGKLYHLINFSKHFDGIIYFQTRGLFRSKQGLQLKVVLSSDEYRAWKKQHLKELVLIRSSVYVVRIWFVLHWQCYWNNIGIFVKWKAHLIMHLTSNSKH